MIFLARVGFFFVSRKLPPPKSKFSIINCELRLQKMPLRRIYDWGGFFCTIGVFFVCFFFTPQTISFRWWLTINKNSGYYNFSPTPPPPPTTISTPFSGRFFRPRKQKYVHPEKTTFVFPLDKLKMKYGVPLTILDCSQLVISNMKGIRNLKLWYEVKRLINYESLLPSSR